jgi:hypothetical protein
MAEINEKLSSQIDININNGINIEYPNEVRATFYSIIIISLLSHIITDEYYKNHNKLRYIRNFILFLAVISWLLLMFNQATRMPISNQECTRACKEQIDAINKKTIDARSKFDKPADYDKCMTVIQDLYK